MKFARGLLDFIRLDGISVDDHDTSQVFFHLTVNWWSLEGVRTWCRCWRTCLRIYALSAWDPRALFELVVRFPGWRQ